MDKLDILHDCLMDTYQFVRADNYLRARLSIGFAIAQIAPFQDDCEELKILWSRLTIIRDTMRNEGLKYYELIMGALSVEIRSVAGWRNRKRAA